jgi:hypothetical protein
MSLTTNEKHPLTKGLTRQHECGGEKSKAESLAHLDTQHSMYACYALLPSFSHEQVSSSRMMERTVL